MLVMALRALVAAVMALIHTTLQVTEAPVRDLEANRAKANMDHTVLAVNTGDNQIHSALCHPEECRALQAPADMVDQAITALAMDRLEEDTEVRPLAMATT